MLLEVVHETRYDYAPPVRTARHLAHLRPKDGEHQRVVSHELAVDPAPADLRDARDVWGNATTCFTLLARHERLRVVSRSVVSTSAPAAPRHSISWEDARERMRYHRGAAYDPASEFIFASPYVPRGSEFVDYALPSFAPGRPLAEAAHDLMTRVHADFEYEPQVTDVGTPAREALRLRKGVCQDFAHVMLACLRSMGVAGRYVSGYLLTQPTPGQARLVGGDASHAWVSVYVPGDAPAQGEWLALDPTNARAPGEDYVVLATGRDYSDVSPLRGVIHGGAHHELHVAVTVAPTIAA